MCLNILAHVAGRLVGTAAACLLEALWPTRAMDRVDELWAGAAGSQTAVAADDFGGDPFARLAAVDLSLTQQRLAEFHKREAQVRADGGLKFVTCPSCGESLNVDFGGINGEDDAS